MSTPAVKSTSTSVGKPKEEGEDELHLLEGIAAAQGTLTPTTKFNGASSHAKEGIPTTLKGDVASATDAQGESKRQWGTITNGVDEGGTRSKKAEAVEGDVDNDDDDEQFLLTIVQMRLSDHQGTDPGSNKVTPPTAAAASASASAVESKRETKQVPAISLAHKEEGNHRPAQSGGSHAISKDIDAKLRALEEGIPMTLKGDTSAALEGAKHKGGTIAKGAEAVDGDDGDDEQFLLTIVQMRASEHQHNQDTESKVAAAATSASAAESKRETKKLPAIGLAREQGNHGPTNHPPCQNTVGFRPGAYSAAPGIELQRATTFVPSMIQGSSNHTCHTAGDDGSTLLLSQPRLLREQYVPRQIQPGAVAEVGGGSEAACRVDSTTATAVGEQQLVDSNDLGLSSSLAVANLVPEEDTLPDLPHAQLQQANEEQNRTHDRKRNQRRSRAGLLVGVIAFVALVLVVVTIFRVSHDGGDDKGEALSETLETLRNNSSNPSQALSSKEYWLSSLPDASVTAITSNPDSPQSMAFQWLLGDSDNLPNYSRGRILQKFAMATLYHATNGDAWDKNTDWLNHSVHECDWYNSRDFGRKTALAQIYPQYLNGFLEPLPPHCNEEGLYQHLWLDQNNLVGSLPDELYLLTFLQTLSIGMNKLWGTVSSQVGLLTALQGLSLSHTQHTGTIPSVLGQLTSLGFLLLADNQFHSALPGELWELTDLVLLSLFDNPLLSGTLSTRLGSFSKLTSLVIDGCQFSGTIPTEVGKMESLEVISASINNISGSLPSELGLATKLSGLSLSENMLRGSIPTQLALASSAALLSLSLNQLTGTLPSELGLLTDLEISLNLNGNKFLTGTLPTELGRLVKLYELDLSNNQFSGSITSQLGRLTTLGHLSVANNSLSGTVPPHLSALQQSLHALNLQGNPGLSGTIPAHLCDINATCLTSAWEPSRCEETYDGLVFSCSSWLCGCGCSCTN